MKTREERLAWALETCRRLQLRMTPVRQAILSHLAGHRTPDTLELIAQAEGVRGCCDVTTVYRTLMMFKEGELVRLVGTPRKNSHFVLNVPDEGGNFLICRSCGEIVELPLPPAILASISRISAEHGFAGAHQDHEVHSLCLRCQRDQHNKVFPSKLPG